MRTLKFEIRLNIYAIIDASCLIYGLTVKYKLISPIRKAIC